MSMKKDRYLSRQRAKDETNPRVVKIEQGYMPPPYMTPIFRIKNRRSWKLYREAQYKNRGITPTPPPE